MERMRDVLRSSLGSSLRDLTPEDRLVAAWQVVCGEAMAAHGEPLYLDAEDVLHVRVDSPEWFAEFLERRSALARELAQVAGVAVSGIHFQKKRHTRSETRNAR